MEHGPLELESPAYKYHVTCFVLQIWVTWVKCMFEASSSPFQKGLDVVQSGWMGRLTAADIPHHTTQGQRREEGLP